VQTISYNGPRPPVFLYKICSERRLKPIEGMGVLKLDVLNMSSKLDARHRKNL